MLITIQKKWKYIHNPIQVTDSLMTCLLSFYIVTSLPLLKLSYSIFNANVLTTSDDGISKCSAETVATMIEIKPSILILLSSYHEYDHTLQLQHFFPGAYGYPSSILFVMILSPNQRQIQSVGSQ